MTVNLKMIVKLTEECEVSKLINLIFIGLTSIF